MFSEIWLYNSPAFSVNSAAVSALPDEDNSSYLETREFISESAIVSEESLVCFACSSTYEVIFDIASSSLPLMIASETESNVGA